MATYEYGQQAVVKFLVQTHLNLLQSDEKDAINALPRDVCEELFQLRERAEGAWGKTEVLRLITDHVSGMTDSYAAMMYQRLTGAASPFHQWI